MSIQKILISQSAPRVLTPSQTVTEKFGAEFQFTPFFRIEPLTSREFRAQRINFLDYTAIVFSSRHVIDAFFSLAEELRAIVGALVLAVVVYAVMIVLTGALTREDMTLIPHGEKLGNLLHLRSSRR